MRSPASPSSAHQDHIQRLLGARAAHSAATAAADVNGPLAQFPDTPSIYSHAVLSPHVPAPDDHFNFPLPSNHRAFHHLRSDSLNDPQASSLDLGDDDDTYPHPHSPPMSPVYDDDDDTDYGREDSPEPRMSMLGPKMRFHSPAPWELEQDSISEQDEPEDDARSVISKRGKGLFKGDSFAKSFGLKSTVASRPSVDSSRSSSGKEKKSFETTSSYVSAGGALHALAQASMSSTSLAINASSAATVRARFPPARPRTRTEPSANSSLNVSTAPGLSPNSSTFPPSSMASPTADRHHTRSSSPAPSSVFSNPLSRTDTRASSRPDSPNASGQLDYVHPYANPDVSSPYRESMRLPPVVHAQRPVAMPSNEPATVTGLAIPRPPSPQGSILSGPAPSIASGIESSSGPSRRPGGGIQGRTISGPIPVESGALRTMASSSSIRSRNRDTKAFPQPHHLPTGFTELPSSPTFTLISLQEAQAQAKERSRSNTIQDPVPFLQQDPQLQRNAPEPTRTSGNRARARSTSAGGGRAKAAAHQGLSLGTPPVPASMPARPDSDVSPVFQTAPSNNAGPPRLKQKRSGFMRLFNAKDRDLDEPPPVPSPSSAPVPPPPPGGPTQASQSAVARPSRPSLARVPVPLFSVDDVEGKDGRPRNAALRRNARALAIVPPPSERDRPSLYATKDGNPSRATLMPEPASAPPGSSEFPSLSLRPVSTVFSAHFADTLGGDFSLDLDPDASTTTSGLSPTSALSPITPDSSLSSRRESDAVAIAAVNADDDPATVIQALQAQIASSRKAWQRQIWELEGQVRDLRAEMEDMRSKERSGARCVYCGRGGPAQDEMLVIAPARKSSLPDTAHHVHGVVNRPRARTGVGAHFGGAT
ncbi:hypothetical protein K488DRAFT_84128 [Vararia minispora EC-137]|uniref:Uncharacterized protein n=1 Tax=Vararia minispora EC-137 TaxID=1314806 RepID=A0ACB8QRG8_9AGAM|nr:hypothetical protein K488DRAFT_84128 [Vararia minispora EC-137]